MRKINLYKYQREDGGIDVSPIKPTCEYTLMYRLVADKGMELVNGDIRTYCVDINVDEVNNWHEETAQEVLHNV